MKQIILKMYFLTEKEPNLNNPLIEKSIRRDFRRFKKLSIAYLMRKYKFCVETATKYLKKFKKR